MGFKGLICGAHHNVQETGSQHFRAMVKYSHYRTRRPMWTALTDALFDKQ